MPCLPILGKFREKVGFICIGNAPVEIKHKDRTYRFEWTGGSGWIPVNKNGTLRLSPVPQAVWDKLEKENK